MLELLSISCTNVISTVLKKKVKRYQHPWGIIHGFEKIFIKHAESCFQNLMITVFWAWLLGHSSSYST